MAETPETKPKPSLVRLGGGQAPGQLSRLSTFKSPRDLTLGTPKQGEKKKFVPNLNLTRNVKKEPASPQGARKEGRRKEGKKEGKKEYKKKDRPELIQTIGWLAEVGVQSGVMHGVSGCGRVGGAEETACRWRGRQGGGGGHHGGHRHHPHHLHQAVRSPKSPCKQAF